MNWLLFFSVLCGATVITAPAAEARRGAVRLMTYNLDFANRNVGATLEAVAAADAEVVLLQEVSPDWRDALIRRFAATYSHRAFHLHARIPGGLAVLSKLPLERDELWAPPSDTGGWYPAERLVVTTAFGPLQLLHVHLRPSLDRGSWVRGFLTTPPVRRKEIAAHWQGLDRTLSTVVAGDFNEGPTGPVIAYLSGQDMTRVPAVGPTTWHYQVTRGGRALDLLRIDVDHIVIDGRLVASDARVLDAGTSDHRPVVATIAPR